MSRTGAFDNLLEKFDVPGLIESVCPFGGGFINDTLLVRTVNQSQDLILQRVNRRVFRDDEAIMSNLRVITDHVAGKLKRLYGDDCEWAVSRIVKAKDGRDYIRDDENHIWRLTTRIMGATSYAAAMGVDHARECGRTLGYFLGLISDIDQSKIKDPIPGFHITPRYLERYDETLHQLAHPPGLKDITLIRAMGFVEARRELSFVFENAVCAGILKRRMLHGDPRINNIMIDDVTHRGRAMIDLDTCAVGLIHMDIGDAIRSICNPSGEDAKDFGEVTFREDLFEAFMSGFLGEARSFMTGADWEYLYPAIHLLPFELGLRFLRDHLVGDQYFNVPEHGQNLHRALVQFRLCEIIETKETKIKKMLEGMRK